MDEDFGVGVKRFFAIPLLVAATGVVVLAGLIGYSRPAPLASESGPIDFSIAIAAVYDDLPASQILAMRDGERLTYRTYVPKGDAGRRLILLVHGSAWHGMQFHSMASALADAGLGTVVVPDLRGHGEAPQRRGDVDYIGQLEDDLADLIGQVRAQSVYDEVVLGGHSSGGGLVVRFAGGEHGALVDRYLVMAPFLKYNAPTTRPNSGGWASVATPRIIGLTILNEFGITVFNHLPVISFAMPKVVLDGPYGATATTSYSFRLNTSFAPRSDYGGDLAKMTQPFLLIAGAQDEAFDASLYAQTISEHTSSGTYVVLPGINHIGVTTEPVAIEAVARWISDRD